MQVKGIQVLIHPSYHQGAAMNPTKQQQKLSDKWDKRAQLVRDTPDAIFVYVSDLRNRELNNPLFPRMAVESARVEKYRAMLGDRLIVVTTDRGKQPTLSQESKDKEVSEGGLSYPALENALEVMQAMEDRGMQVDTSTQMSFFGEYATACVPQWGKALGRTLEISDERRRLDKELSLDPRSFLEKIGPALGIPSAGRS